MRKIILLTLIILGLLYVLPVAAQQTGSIVGTVSDPSGAMVPKAEVTITNEETGLKRTVAANQEGFYTFAQLPYATYTISVTAPGFKTATKTGIDLHVAESKTVPMALELGSTSEVVTVTGGATAINLRTGEVANLIDSQQMTELPLNGRSFVQLTLLVPGAAAGDNQKSSFTGLLGGVDISMSGSPANANMWLVDGADNVDHGSGRTILVYPSVDAIEEFKVQRNAYGAENQASGGAQINLVTRGGSNAFHGSVYEFFRNDIFNANNFFLNRVGKDKPKLRYNNFGYTFNGPIVKDKLFFFWSEEWRREVRGVTRKATVPTDLERQGNFSGIHSANLSAPVDPFTGQAFPNNTIPTNRRSAAGFAVLQKLPLANVASATQDNWVQAVPTGIFTRQEQIRADYNIGSKHQIMARYTQDAWNNPAPNYAGEGGLWGDDGFPTVDSNWAQPSKSLSTRLTTTFGPTAVNSFQFSYSNNRIFITEGIGANINADIISKIPTVFPGKKTHYSVFWAGAPVNSLWNIAPWDNAMDVYNWKDDFTKTVGNHSLKFGGLIAVYKKDEDMFYDSVSPSFWGPVPGGAGLGGGWGDSRAPGNGNGGITGNLLADLLLKDVWWAGGDEASNQVRSKVRWHDIEIYFADTWRVKPRFTLDYGVRWSMLPPSYQGDYQMGNWIPSLWDPKVGTSDPLNGVIFPAELSMPDKGIKGGQANLRGLDLDKALRKGGLNTIAPRLGFAWDPVGDGKWSIRMGSGFFYGRPDMTMPTGQMIGNPPFRSTLSWWAGRPLDALGPDKPTAGVGLPGYSVDTKWKVQGSYQWNFTVEHEIMKDTKLEVAYVANRGHHLPTNWDMNYVPIKDWLNYARLNYAPGGSGGAQDQLRKWYNFRGNQNLWFITQGGVSSYHSGQLYLTKRFSNNFSYQMAYTFSKLLSNVGVTCCGADGNNRLYSPEIPWYTNGPADFDRTQVLTLNAIYRMPSFAKYGKAASQVIGDWELTGIYGYSTGIPLTPTLGSSLVGISTNRPDMIGDPNSGPRTAERWFNTAAFAVPTKLGVLGNSGKGQIRAPATNNMDFAIYKNFKLTERMKMQFRFETFNTFNHTQLKAIDTGFSLPDGMTADLTTNTFVKPSQCTNWPNCTNNANFGRAGQVRDPREIQMALKFIF